MSNQFCVQIDMNRFETTSIIMGNSWESFKKLLGHGSEVFFGLGNPSILLLVSSEHSGIRAMSRTFRGSILEVLIPFEHERTTNCQLLIEIWSVKVIFKVAPTFFLNQWNPFKISTGSKNTLFLQSREESLKLWMLRWKLGPKQYLWTNSYRFSSIFHDLRWCTNSSFRSYSPPPGKVKVAIPKEIQ